ncbi:uncharacterized protein BJ212DRAFT_1301134 [Suillus subaureus]|uniref:Uncharacterized protein n=1 Tax=Suillus subaureus TaxID=48587 RepID=A0A9P7JBD9_9AGAM|nr:uncharacterized protein BJ212DRAFT_1301134 [Suillus subaureus]KAG1813217.1 hypothetical protein BJ212DRAFT_1301134 [Suillus subaureus]
MLTCRTEQDIMLQVSGYHPPKDIYSSPGSTHIPPLLTQVHTSDPWKLTMKRQVAPPYTISLLRWEDPSMYIRSLEAEDAEAGCTTQHLPPSNSSYILLCPPSQADKTSCQSLINTVYNFSSFVVDNVINCLDTGTWFLVKIILCRDYSLKYEYVDQRLVGQIGTEW